VAPDSGDRATSATRDRAAAPLLDPAPGDWLVLQRPEQRTPEEEHLLAQLTVQDARSPTPSHSPKILPSSCASGQPAQLDPWLARAAESPLSPCSGLRTGCETTMTRSKLGVTLPWSNGPVEGHINRFEDAQAPDVLAVPASICSQRRFLLAA